MSNRKLTLDDIADMRAYERERAQFRQHVIELKRRRRVSVGPHITLVFENRDTIRFQIQEMARIERLYSDEQIENELRVYNPLVPEPGHLSATMFIELTNDDQLREWLPKLVGIERAVYVAIGDGADAERVAFTADSEHGEQLTRSDTTSAVHYVHLSLTAEQIERFTASPVMIGIDLANYRHESPLGDATIAELTTDLRDDS
ncbi:MAG TPA: DUF3501 family protein [Acidimicrobiales bacterium]|nr:DUF3501 family protein [Acidimicrobiales bacterium]